MPAKLPPDASQEEVDRDLFLRLATLFPDERRHMLRLLEEGSILDCIRKPEEPASSH